MTRHTLIAALLSFMLSLTYATAQPPKVSKKASNPFTFVHVADPQLEFDMNFDLEQTARNYQHTIRQIHAIRPDFVVVTGDMINKASAADQTELYDKLIKEYGDIPVLHIPGNHDYPECNIRNHERYMARFGYDRFSFVHGKCAFIGINSNYMMHETNRTASINAYEQLKWLEQQLASYMKCNHVFLFMHHPIDLMPNSKVGHKSPLDAPWRNLLVSILKRYNVSAVFVGHTHITEICDVEGIPLITMGASSYPLYGSITGINKVDVTPTAFNCTFVPSDESKAPFSLYKSAAPRRHTLTTIPDIMLEP